MDWLPNETEVGQITTVLKALSEPNRLRIFATLMNGDSCNCELQETLGLAPNLLSHHLRVLREVGLVSSRRDTIDGRWIYYAVEQEAVIQWRNWFASFLDSGRMQAHSLCGPEGQQITVEATIAYRPAT